MSSMPQSENLGIGENKKEKKEKLTMIHKSTLKIGAAVAMVLIVVGGVGAIMFVNWQANKDFTEHLYIKVVQNNIGDEGVENVHVVLTATQYERVIEREAWPDDGDGIVSWYLGMWKPSDVTNIQIVFEGYLDIFETNYDFGVSPDPWVQTYLDFTITMQTSTFDIF